LAGTGQKPPWIIHQLLLAQSATQVSAHPHSMKSLAWLAACIESVAKQIVWEHFDATAVKKSLFIESEDSQWVIEERIRGIAKGLGLHSVEDAPGFHYLRTGPFDLVNLGATLKAILDHYRPDFAVLSTLQNLLEGKSWNEQRDMQPINQAIVRLASECCPLVVITHSPWDKRAKRAAGTITQAANFLTTMHFEKVSARNASDAFVHVSIDSKIGAEQTDFNLRLETEGDEVRGIAYGGSGWPKGVGKDAVLAAIEADDCASAKDIAARTGVSVRYVQKIMKTKRKE